MSFSITNNSAGAVITKISSTSSSYGTFTITGGTLPLYPNQTITGSNTEINNQNGSQFGTIQLFIKTGDVQLEVYKNGSLFSALSYSCGIAPVQIPILLPTDSLVISIANADLPTPSLTPTNTATNTPRPTITPTKTLTPTPSITPTATPVP